MEQLLKEIKNELSQIRFNKSTYRASINKNNIKPESIIFGYRTHFGHHGLSANTLKYPEFYEHLKQLMHSHDPDFKFTTITVNKNFKCLPHYDGNNVGDSYIIGLGDYKHGEINVEGKKYDIHNKFLTFNGSKMKHWVEPWTGGDRYTLVYYNNKNYKKKN